MKAAELKARLLGSQAFGPLSGTDFAGLLRHLAREDLVEQIADGSLVLGLKGQRIVEHFTFFAAFRTPIEFRVIHGNAEIGKLPELTAPTPGDHVILAGKRWLVERVDPDRREIGVIPSKGKKRPKFTSLGGDVHPAVHAKMQALLSGDVRPSYLDDTAFEMLVAARGAAAAYHDCRPALVSSGGRVKLFVWQGSRITRTILLVLAGAGLKVRDEEVGLDVEGSLEAVRSALMSFLSNPDGERLASVAEESLHARLLGGDKFDRYLPPELWRRAFVAERLDVPGALAFIREVMAPDPTPPSGGPGGLDDASSSGSLSSVASSAAPVSFRPLVSLWSPACGGFDTSARRGTLGEPCWAPAEFLSDLELRLGLPPVHVAPTVRAQIWAVRMEDLGTDHFFSRSLSIDRLGTARALLELRDQLLDAGWNGEIVDHAGERIDVIRRLEATQSPMLPFGLSDRLRRVEGALERTRTAPYQAVRLCEDESLWSGRWRRVFDLLRDRGTRVAVEPPPAWAIDGSEQDENTDLGTLKHVLSSAVAHGVAAGPSTPAGDGSVVILRTETSGEAAESVAALARSWAPADLILIRGGDHAVLDAALSGQRLPTLGTAEASAWRPLLGVLPLTLELIFEPRDPLRLIEILTLPGGPFRGHVGWSLARAVAAEPGVGGRRWTKEIVRLRSLCEPPTSDVASDEEEAPRCVEIGRIQRQLSRVADWLEGPLYDPVVGAPRAAVLETLGRIRSWALGRLQTSGIIQRDRSAVIGQLEALALALAADPRQVFPRDAVRQLVGDVRGAGDRQPLWPEEAGRLEHVHHPSALRRRCNVVVWWNFVEAAEDRGAASPWRQSERTALTSAGIRFVDPARIQEARARSWRRAVLAANRRLLLVLPARAAGDPTAPHPFLDEVVAALGLDESGLTKLTITPDQLLAGTLPGGLPAPPADRVEPLALPTAKRSWQADPGVLQAPPLGLTVEALEALLGCPLKWALQYRARLRRSAVGDVPPVHRLAGILGHRLVEELHRSATAANQSFDVTTAPAVLDRLIATEGAVLLRPGMSFEREQLRRDLLRAVDQLASFLAESGFRISAVEDAFTAPWDGRELSGRLDLLLARPGGELVLDLKWGHSSYRDAIEHGQALQLGAYAYMRAQATSGTWPATAYYSLSRGVVLTADEDLAPSIPVIAGKKAPEVWEAASCSLKAVRNILDTGRLPVTGLARSLPLLADAGVQDATGHLVLAPEKACEFCACQPICGKSWEEFENADA
jgi:hypothetical protein